MTLYDWPRASAFGRVIPKNKIYEHAGANTALKDLFVREVDQIVWSHKLAPETINLPATKSVVEIQVFRITQREKALSADVLRAIDRAIPFPLLFELVHGGKIKLAAAYKRQSETDRTKWVLGDYFESLWLNEDAPRTALPVALTIGTLYEQLLSPLVDAQTVRLAPGLTAGFAEAPQASFTAAPVIQPLSLEERIAQADAIKAATQEVERIKARLAREKQFNKRVGINAELRGAREELRKLMGVVMAKSNEPYQLVLVESYRPNSTSGLHGDVHVRPRHGQGFPSTMHVECSKSLSRNYPVGTVFRIRAKLTDREGSGDFLYSYFGWKYDVVELGKN